VSSFFLMASRQRRKRLLAGGALPCPRLDRCGERSSKVGHRIREGKHQGLNSDKRRGDWRLEGLGFPLLALFIVFFCLFRETKHLFPQIGRSVTGPRESGRSSMSCVDGPLHPVHGTSQPERGVHGVRLRGPGPGLVARW
jgi:hypothetical protein